MELTLNNLELANFRSYRSCRLEFASRSVLFCGPNGAGKSNLLEAVYFLSILRSFRTSGVRDLVRIGARSFGLRAEIRRAGYPEIIEVEQAPGGGRRLLIDGTAVRRSSEFIREFRAVAFSPEDKAVTAGSSSCRRRFFDMFLSVMEPEYLQLLQRYAAALAQRNAALRQASAALAAAAAFEPELTETALRIAALRRSYAGKLGAAVNLLPGGEGLTIDYQPSGPEEPEAYRKKLDRERRRDVLCRYTSFGPQLDEFLFRLDGRLLRSFGSNGQLRLMALYLRMAEFSLVRAAGGAGVVALVDDVTGELDREARERFFALLDRADQVFYTFTEPPADARFADAQRIELPL